jgi:hypothetical protein
MQEILQALGRFPFGQHPLAPVKRLAYRRQELAPKQRPDHPPGQQKAVLHRLPARNAPAPAGDQRMEVRVQDQALLRGVQR